MRIKEEIITTLRELPILEVVERYPDITLKKSGDAYKGNSPWTNEKTPSFFVHPKKNLYKCFSTGKGGNNAIKFVMEKEGVEYLDAIKSLASQHGITLDYEKGSAPKEDNSLKVDIRNLLDWSISHFCSNSIPESFSKYRAFPDSILEAFKVGYATPSWDDLLNFARSGNVDLEKLVAAGLLRKKDGGGYYDYFRDRITFPIMDWRGNIVAYTARNAETQKVEEGREAPPKYINSPDACFDKSQHLFGLYQAIKGNRLSEGAFLVEGPTDVLRWHLHGFTNTVAPCGSALTEHQAKLLKRFTDKLTFVPDNDCDKPKNAGLEALQRNAPIAIKAGFSVKVLIPGIL